MNKSFAVAHSLLLCLTFFTSPAFAGKGDGCGFSAADFPAQLAQLKDQQELRRLMAKKEADIADQDEITKLGLDFLAAKASVLELQEARLALTRNYKYIAAKMPNGQPFNISYRTLPTVIEETIAGAGSVKFKPVGSPFYWQSRDGWSNVTINFSQESYEVLKPSDLQGKLIVFFESYQAYAGVVASIDSSVMTLVNLDGQVSRHFLNGSRQTIGISHIHIYDGRISLKRWQELQTRMLIRPMLQDIGVIYEDLLPQKWKSINPDEESALFITDMSLKKITDRLIKLLKEKGSLKLLLVSGNLNKTGNLGPAEIVQLNGVDVTSIDNGKIGLILSRDGRKVREEFKISGKEYGPVGLSQIFYLNE